MVHQQDSSDLTGVKHLSETNPPTRARERKANAAVELKVAGATWEEIARVLGYPTPRAAIVATERALEKRLLAEDRDKMRAMAGQRLEKLLRSVWAKATDPYHPEHLLGVSRARDIIDRHAKLFGLDAPTEMVVHTPTMQEMERWAAQMLTEQAPAVQEADVIELDDSEWEETEPDALPTRT